MTVCDDVREPATLDPQKEFIEKNHTIVQQIYEGLVRFDPNGTIEPALAVSWKKISPTVTQFFLRKDVFFHNGEPFDADSVKFSIERYLDPKTGFPAAGFIQGLKTVEVIDPLTINIVTAYPDDLLLNRLAGFVMMVPSGYVRKNGDDALKSHPIGTGPFRFKAWIPNEQIELEANKNYWQKPWPKIPVLIFRFVKLEEQIPLLLAHKLDIVTDIPGTETYAIQTSGVAAVIKCPSLTTVGASFNSNSAPLQNKLVRQALNYAINKEELIRYALLGNGQSTASLALQEPSKTTLNPYAYDPEKAKRLLKNAGYPNGFTVHMIEVKATRTAKIIAAHWKRIGLDVDFTSATDATIGEQLKSGKWDIFLGYCPDPMYHPFFIHSIFLYSKSPYSLTNDPKLDHLIEALVAGGSVSDLTTYVNEEAFTLFTYRQIKTYGVRNGITFEPYKSGMPYFRQLDVESDETQ